MRALFCHMKLTSAQLQSSLAPSTVMGVQRQEVYTAVGTAVHKVAELYKKPEEVQAPTLRIACVLSRSPLAHSAAWD